MRYDIRWRIECDDSDFDQDEGEAESAGAVRAALWALGVQRDPKSVATVFSIRDNETGEEYIIDVEDPDSPTIM